jgi:hypothetical protein
MTPVRSRIRQITLATATPLIVCVGVCIGAIVVTGCSRRTPSAQGGTADAATASPTPTPSSSPEPSPVPPVDFSALLPFLPEAPGWTRSTPTGETIATGLNYSKVVVDYAKDESLIRLELCDSALNRVLLAPLSTMLVPTYAERTTIWHKQFVKIRNLPGFEAWDSDTKEAELTVVAANRFIITARGTNMSDLAPVKSLVQSIDLARLAALK